jgi:hypothetical protein
VREAEVRISGSVFERRFDGPGAHGRIVRRERPAQGLNETNTELCGVEVRMAEVRDRVPLSLEPAGTEPG